MSEYKRLTNNNLEEYDPEYDFCIDCKYFGEPNGCNRPNGTCGNYDRFLETYNRLAELEDKIENKNLIELPCKVGDMVYIPYKFRNKNGVLETIIEEIRIEEKHTLFWAKPLYTNNSIRVKYLGWKKSKDFNKTWFLTKAGAEAKLKELQ